MENRETRSCPPVHKQYFKHPVHETQAETEPAFRRIRIAIDAAHGHEQTHTRRPGSVAYTQYPSTLFGTVLGLLPVSTRRAGVVVLAFSKSWRSAQRARRCRRAQSSCDTNLFRAFKCRSPNPRRFPSPWSVTIESPMPQRGKPRNALTGVGDRRTCPWARVVAGGTHARTPRALGESSPSGAERWSVRVRPSMSLDALTWLEN